MFVSRGRRFKDSNYDPTCPCKCKSENDKTLSVSSPLSSRVTGPKMVPGVRFHTPPKKEESILYPRIDTVRTQSPRYKIGERFKQRMLYSDAGIDSPGPLAYNIEGPFERLRKERARSSDKSTFGSSTRNKPIVKPKVDKEIPVLDLDTSFRKTQEHGNHGPLLLSKLDRSYDNGVPGPGHYDVSREVDSRFTPRMRSPTAAPRLRGKAPRPSSAPGYYDTSRSLLKESHNRGYSDTVKPSCDHSKHCCKHCCKHGCGLCGRSPRTARLQA